MFQRGQIINADHHITSLPASLQRMVPLDFNQNKRLRFEAYCLEKNGQCIVFDIPNNMMTASQLRNEKSEFEKIFREHEQKKG